MTDTNSITDYKTAIATFKQWHYQGAITLDDLLHINQLVAAKYGLSSSSLFLDRDLLCKEKRVSNSTKKG